MLVVAIDGMDRKLLYEMLEKGDLPEMAKLLSGGGGKFPHAHFDETLLSTLPSTTIAAWVSAFTGVPPAVHGVSGNEFFIRPSGPARCADTRHFQRLAAGDRYVLGRLRRQALPGADRLRANAEARRERPDLGRDAPGPAGADQLLVMGRTVIADAFWPLIEAIVATGKLSDPRAAGYLVDQLLARRTAIGRAFLDAVTPLDHFRAEHGRLCAVDLATRYGPVHGGTLEHLDARGEPLESVSISRDGSVCFSGVPSRYTALRRHIRRGGELRPPMQVHVVRGTHVIGIVRIE